MRWVYRRRIPSWYLYPRLEDLFTFHSARRVYYDTNVLFNPDLFRVYSPRLVAFTTAKEPHLPLCGRRPPPIVLLVEIHKSEILKLIFMSVFLHIIVELGEKYALKHFFNHFEAKLTLRNQKS